MKLERNHPPEQNAEERRKNFEEVTGRFSPETAKAEAGRCLQCKHAPCVKGCPVSVDIPGFILALREDRLAEANDIIRRTNNLPAVCGRVCPQEAQCEAVCVRARMEGAVAVGALERFVGDKFAGKKSAAKPMKKRLRAAVVGSGPAGLACAADIAAAGYGVTVFEAFHEPGGVLTYGIPEFRLPKALVKQEIEQLKGLGVEIELNTIVGKTVTMRELREEFDAVFIGSGAGLPVFPGIPGEGLIGVLSANEYLTRVNLMRGYLPGSDTPVPRGRRVAVFGAGNVAMDAARTAVRMGAEEVTIVYRRTFEEMPARVEEIRHAREEGVRFQLLTAPLAFTGEEGVLTGVTVQRCELGEPDARGRKRPVPVPGGEFTLPADMAIVAIGTSPNPIIAASFPALKVEKSGIIAVDEQMATNIPGIWAGGDAVTGAATVIKAMGAGKIAAKGIIEYLAAVEQQKT